jgi:DNA polymerase I
VLHFASEFRELCCHRVLGWPIPERILDLYPEFVECTNGLERPAGKGLIGALVYFGLDHIDATEKTEMREKFMADKWDRWNRDEREAGLDYCETDVRALEQLLPAMLSRLDLPHALLRGRYMAAVSAMEHNGVPIDVVAAL